MKIRKAIIPCAGFGTRFLPFTKSQAKEMLPIIDKPAIEYIVQEAINSGIEEILLIIRSGKNNIANHFNRNKELEHFLVEKNKLSELELISEKYNATIYYIMQEEQLGLGHAISLAKEFIKNEPFAILLGDDLFKCNTPAIKQLIDVFEKYQQNVLGTICIDKKDSKKYGICKVDQISDDVYKVESLIEKPDVECAPSNIAIGGRYVLLPEVFKYLDMQIKGKSGEIELTDAILKTLDETECYAKVINGSRYDLGNKIGYLHAILDFGLEREDLKDQFLSLIETKIEKITASN
ncbi:UTP--glucose-1-phosphate uridylyltransferase [Mycoplasma feriruminatoris]|uniref:UTP--glucose-1-phosphate uridylyltransferase n=1 Tax=Mycoplasma feriruminatoris TaxID=1179777 RepID=A0A654IPS7_9MOLU|nr:UTP--glucose-1-phosphate uridylyltransferase [Mycoplasma feriruminatoris]WFQ92976.1 UTP--glucose-1-phosphate uridylyltransferase [Mycoplasma feriruminatoris]VZS00751.1 UTP--glucose-1-phosphate uridylyltransferase [Mycoplasma feriruminatoris]VZS00879.1 UTP--glucose-1-phosphate uridylyltransferase [Mycoplasma feriruminatoris]